VKVGDVHSSLISVWNEWKEIIVNPKYIRRENEITWEGFSGKKISDDIVTASTVSQLVDEGQYSFQVVIDGSIFQIHYSFDRNGNLATANLAFYYSGVKDDYDIRQNFPTQLGEAQKLEEQILEEGMLWEYRQLILSQDDPVGWLRIDYGPEQYRGLLHANCHMHLGLFPRSRFIVDGVPNPKQFVEFVIAMCYPDFYAMKRLDEKGLIADKNKIYSLNDPNFPVKDDESFECLTQIHVPTRTVQALAIPEALPAEAAKPRKKRR
jgi:hypothetical protein